MNSDQRNLIIKRDGGRCVITHRKSNLTVDHIRGRRVIKGEKVDEGWENVWTLWRPVHMEKDHNYRLGQIKFIEKLIERGDRHKFRLVHVLGLLKSGKNLKEIGMDYARQFEGKESDEYTRAYNREKKEYKERKLKQAKARRRSREYWKRRAKGFKK